MSDTLLDRIWRQHVLASPGGEFDLLHVDRHLLNEHSAPSAMQTLQRRSLQVRNPELTFALPERHEQASVTAATPPPSPASLTERLRRDCAAAGIRWIDRPQGGGCVPCSPGAELGLTLPGLTVLCSGHSTGHGALGALSWSIDARECLQVLATQTVLQRKPRSLRIELRGSLAPGINPKDIMLALVGRYGSAIGRDHALEFTGDTVTRLDIPARMMLCGLAEELGARIALIAPDQAVLDYLQERPYAPRGELWMAAANHWQALAADAGPGDGAELALNVEALAPQVTWGIHPSHGDDICGSIPFPEQAPGRQQRRQWRLALHHMGLQPGTPLRGIPVDHVVIGCHTSGHLPELRAAAELVRGQRVARGVRAVVVPGSRQVQAAAEAAGLARVFDEAGFEWREAGWSLFRTLRAASGRRCLTTSSRDFRLGRRHRVPTHLASTRTAAVSALAGCIEDPRRFAA